MRRRVIAGLCLAALLVLPACSRDDPPNSMFEDAGYHVRGDKVYYLNAFPGKAVEIEGADPGSFDPLDRSYARDGERVYVDGRQIADADPRTFEVLDRPPYAKDARHVYRWGEVLSDDPAHFELLDGDLSRDGRAVYWSDGRVLSDDPRHFAIISVEDHYLFTKDARTVHVNGEPIDGADPATFRVLEGAYAVDDRSAFYFTRRIADADRATFAVREGAFAADARHVYWMGEVIDGADPVTFRVLNRNFDCSADARRDVYQRTPFAGADPADFPRGRDVTGCSATSMSFAE